MKKLNTFIKYIFLIISLSFLTFTTGFTQTITNSGITFNPDTLQVTIGDNISFNISASHNAVEVSETTFNNNDTTSNNGFNIPYGGGSFTADSIKTYYYVCQPHASMGMKGVIIVNPPPCNKSLTQQLEGFDPNPLYSHMLWSFDTLSLTNTSDCNIRVRPEFVIAHDSLAIGANDLVLKWYNPYTGSWPAIPYYINGNGHAVGFWSSSAIDTTGQDINQGATQQIIIKVKFWPTANYGTYSANWTTKEVDLSGNIMQILATGDTTALSLVDCSIYGIDSTYSSNITCNNDNNGATSIISVQNGSGETLYNWSNGDTTNSISNLSPSTYYCVVTDANWQQCTDSISFIITEPPPLTSTYTQTNVSCFGVNDGSAIVNLFGGAIGSVPVDTNYILGWEGTVSPVYLLYPQTVFNTSLLPNPYNQIHAGVYPYTVTDLNGCTIFDTITITEPDSLYLNYSTTNFNGYAISCYGLNDGEIDIQVTGGTSPFDNYLNGTLQGSLVSDNLNDGTYSDSIIDANGCTAIINIILNEPIELVSTLTSTNISCNGICDGDITSSTSGGVSPYSFAWSPQNQTTNTISNLCVGNYTLNVTDGNGCPENVSTIITEPQPLSSILSADSILCHNSNTQAEINVWGGSQPFTYLWSNGDINYITNLSSGNHSVIATDQNGCSISNSITLSNPDSILAQTTTTNVSCNSFSDGTVNINVSSGGLTPYIYSNNSGLTYQNSNVFSNLSAGVYSYLISDFNGCLGVASAVINEPTQLTSIAQSDSISCYDECDGNVYVIANEGTPPYAYNWGGTSANLCAGIYNVTITDANGCLASNSVIVYEPNPLVINIWINGNNIEATSGFVSYQWYNTNGTLISGATSESFSPSSMGEYYVVVTDGICEESSYAIYYNVSDINNFNTDFKIYPNPTQGMITIESNISFESISLLNRIGNQLLLVENNNNDKGPTELDLSTFAKGIYFIQIEQNNQIMNYRIVLQ